MFSVLIFILILSVLVLVHEFGHFITAKKLGIKVEEFGLGIPPRVYGKKIGETIYSINALPFGGFVRLKGEDSFEYDESDLNDPRNFISKTPLQRTAVLLAGVFMNILLGAFLFYIFMFMNGFKTTYIPMLMEHDFAFGNVRTIDTTIFGISDKSPLKDEVKLGEAITYIDGKSVNSVMDVREAVEDEEEVSVIIKDLITDEDERQLIINPYQSEEGDDILGVYLGSSAQIYYQKPLQKLFSGFLHTFNVLTYSIDGFGYLISVSFQEGTAAPISEGVSGPVGIYSIVDDILDYPQRRVLLDLIDLTALISVSLAFLNILPLPALDGGRVFFIILELIRGKRVNAELEAKVHKVGIVLFMLLFILVSIRDIIRIF